MLKTTKNEIKQAYLELTRIGNSINHSPGCLIGSNYSYTSKYKEYLIGFDNPAAEIAIYQDKIILSALNCEGLKLIYVLKKLAFPPFIYEQENQIFCYINTTDSVIRVFFEIIRQMMQRIKIDAEDSFYGFYGAIQFEAPYKKHQHNNALGVFYIPTYLVHFNVIDGKIAEKALKTTYQYEVENNFFKKAHKPMLFPMRNTILKSKDETSSFPKLVKKALQAIKSHDDSLQTVNPSVVISSHTQKTPYEVFKYLFDSNPAPYNFLVNLNDQTIFVGSSPAMFIRGSTSEIQTSPIAGTIARGQTESEDRKNIDILIASHKDDQELQKCILLDIEIKENICKSYNVLISKEIEKFSNVFHTSAYVSGTLKKDVFWSDAIYHYMWPATVTGYPISEALNFIQDSELSQRGWYSGCIGFIKIDGSFDFGLSIRAALIDKHGLALTRVGTSIVSESTQVLENEELRAKASVILKALAS